MYFITTKRMLEVCFSAHPNIQYRTFIAYDLRGFSDVTWSCGPVKGSRAFIWVSPGGGFTTAGKNLRKGVVS